MPTGRADDSPVAVTRAHHVNTYAAAIEIQHQETRVPVLHAKPQVNLGDSRILCQRDGGFILQEYGVLVAAGFTQPRSQRVFHFGFRERDLSGQRNNALAIMLLFLR